ncbi:pentatricopeptide repeat-containing protein At5g59600-like [Impatiens glandulifera]|uniref:pentatricopeptide repeat-containing protein At5g59600-like n=1 Tax=Impatiens glandulifera TaxID=253017 RepID=UPI001FB0D681|nr:pentatricopeptide repeat-containing protein At5g59600-like [Impatiens glandulifera]
MKFSICLPSVDELVLILEKCTKAKRLIQCKQIHGFLLGSGFEINTASMDSKLVASYAASGDLRSAHLLFHQIQSPNIFAFNWMISSNAFIGAYDDSLSYFSSLQVSSTIYPNTYTFSSVLKAYVGLNDLKNGSKIHSTVRKLGFVFDLSVGNALIDMYCKCGNLSFARQLFDEMPTRDVASLTSMICGYSNAGQLNQSILLFEKMKSMGLQPNDFTWNAMITAHARVGDCEGTVRWITRMTTEQGLVPDLKTWNAVISGFVQSQRLEEALRAFQDMFNAGVNPNHVTVTAFLPACGLAGLPLIGKAVHGLIYRMGLSVNIFVASALIDMYSKCGRLMEARIVFDKTRVKNVASWNAMIGCYGKHGMVDSSLNLFERMKDEGVEANEVTFLCVLSACGHGSLVEKGLDIYKQMRPEEVKEEHRACVLDLLCRSGRMEEAYEIVKEMKMEVTDSMIGAFLNGCKVHEREDLAKRMVVKMEAEEEQGKKKKGACLVAMSNVFAVNGEWEQVEKMRNEMKEKRVLKKPGFSSVENCNHLFKDHQNYY